MQLELQDLVIEPPLRIFRTGGETGTLVVSCSSVGKKRHSPPPPEFVKIATAGGKNPALFITDQSRSWLNAPGMAETIVRTVEDAAEKAGATRIAGIGDSMGATMLLHLSRLTRFDSVLAMTPQYSANPKVVPEEDRWRFFRSKIREFRFDRIENLDAAQTKYFILHGDGPGELEHALRFPKTRGVAHFILPGFGHRVSETLKERGYLVRLAQDAIAGRRARVRRTVEELGGMFRNAYEKQMADRPVRKVAE